jgi:2-polyprenyl-3-methyl-5-hydroxy-6-metoxy-1,4-benzoquinol methylase
VSFADLGLTPLANSYVPAEAWARMEPFYPLHAFVCTECWLVQLDVFEAAENIFDDEYAYFSSYSDSWLAHAERYARGMTERLQLDATSLVVEIASNDGYLLQYFKAAGIPVLGVDPTRNTAAVAMAKGIPTRVEFFGSATAAAMVQEGQQADLLVGNNVLAHVPDLNDFVGGLKVLLKPHGVITMEFPHLQNLVEQCQFDTIYHEHFSYLSFSTVERVFRRHGLALFDVEELPTHGGSLRIFACHRGAEADRRASARVDELRSRERRLGYEDVALYRSFSERVKETKRSLLELLIDAKRAGKSIAGYGAPAKGNTLLNYCGVRTDMVDYTVDRSPHKQGRLLPGTRIPVFAPERIAETRPDYVLILPWNLKDEIVGQLAHVREWGGRFIVPIPTAQVI